MNLPSITGLLLTSRKQASCGPVRGSTFRDATNMRWTSPLTILPSPTITTMPEGDTIFRTARTLQRALGGQVVRTFETQLAGLALVDQRAPIAGRTVQQVSA